MFKPKIFLKDLKTHPAFESRLVKWLRPWRMKTYVDILIVVDEQISISGNSFGISSVIDLIRNTQVGCMKFRIDIAIRSSGSLSVVTNPTNLSAKYSGFRFNSSHNGADIIDKYEQIWCFGFRPSNSGSTNDAEIDLASSLPTSTLELEKLDSWMTIKKGGLFGTGDHHFLGASMCRKIPRLGTMRRWTNADGVPPIDTPARIDTLRPPSSAYEPGAPGGPLALSNSTHQSDLTVQPIRWTAWKSSFHPLFFRRKRPHPILCHPTLGPIDVMPDHAHEGLCVPLPDLNALKQFNGGLEYPNATAGGQKPKPKIIAYGSNLSGPPYNFSKGPQPARSNNPMIATYDGHTAGVGRVVTDSTWHHWMNTNIDNLKATNNKDWEKISRYFINIAVWLNPPGYSTKCFYLSVIISHIESPGFQEYSLRASSKDLGASLRKHLVQLYGPCWVTERIWDVIRELELIPLKKIPGTIKTFNELRVDPGHLEELILGNMVKTTLKQAEKLKVSSFDDKKLKIKPLTSPEKLFKKPIASALKSFAKEMKGKSKMNKKLRSAFNL